MQVLMDRADANKDGFVDKDELTSFAEAARSATPSKPPQVPEEAADRAASHGPRHPPPTPPNDLSTSPMSRSSPRQSPHPGRDLHKGPDRESFECNVVYSNRCSRFPSRDRLAAGEGLGVSDAGEVAPEGVRSQTESMTPGLPGAGFPPVASHSMRRRDLGVELVGDIEQQARAFDDPEGDAEVIKDTCRVERHPGDIRFRKLRPEPCLLDEPSGGRVIGMRVLPERREQQPGSRRTEHGGQGAAVRQGRLQAPVR